MLNLGREDVVLIISNSDPPKGWKHWLRERRKNGSTLVLITNNRESPWRRSAIIKIITATRKNFLQKNSGFPE